MKKIVSGNEAIALGALAAGVKVVTGYPGTPSSEVLGSLYKRNDLADKVHIEWSVNEKVAVEIAGSAAWVGQRTLCTMKMSGVNVAYDSLIGIAYSGCRGGMVIYVADDPGVSTGMCEQDSREFAQMADMPMLEPATVEQCYDMVQFAFELSEAIESPVFLRSVTNVAQSHAPLEYEDKVVDLGRKAVLEKNIAKYTKAGSAICTAQHKHLLAAFDKAEGVIRQAGYNTLTYGKKDGIGVVAVGVANCYIDEAFDIAKSYGADLNREDISVLNLYNTLPFASDELRSLLVYCSKVVVLEELEPLLEKEIIRLAYEMGLSVEIIGKYDGTYSRLGEYNAAIIADGLCRAAGVMPPVTVKEEVVAAEKLAAARPITVCAGCPHRGTYISINKAIRKKKYKLDEVVVTGDIGCTILGMNAPFNSCWTEVSMGASTPIAMGYIYGGDEKPVIATIGDSTFFHAGIPGIINAIQQNVKLTVVILDNGWTAMTGMQINPGTAESAQLAGCNQIDLVKVVEGLGVAKLIVTDPYDIKATTDAIASCIDEPGVKVVVARRECAIQANRRKVTYGKVVSVQENCTKCKVCVTVTGCPALTLTENGIVIDYSLCNGCGICVETCNQAALIKEEN